MEGWAGDRLHAALHWGLEVTVLVEGWSGCTGGVYCMLRLVLQRPSESRRKKVPCAGVSRSEIQRVCLAIHYT
jgi:hypothetical protein